MGGGRRRGSRRREPEAISCDAGSASLGDRRGPLQVDEITSFFAREIEAQHFFRPRRLVQADWPRGSAAARADARSFSVVISTSGPIHQFIVDNPAESSKRGHIAARPAHLAFSSLLRCRLLHILLQPGGPFFVLHTVCRGLSGVSGRRAPGRVGHPGPPFFACPQQPSFLLATGP